ncbi:hypothetical protein HanIR_Chr03g0121781 [Helianthus annuus]|nr:hypothetical protein HanIR_Chr03g0121781 [Helianthus annuus]
MPTDHLLIIRNNTTFSGRTIPFAIFSLRKCKSISKCLVRYKTRQDMRSRYEIP